MTLGKTILALTGTLAISACSSPGPSVPFAAGQTMEVARDSVNTCAAFAPDGGRLRVGTMYFVNGVLFGIIPGAVGTAIYREEIYANGEAAAVDRCLKDLGFTRRDLTPAEMRALDAADPTTRAALLDHFVIGGQLDDFSGT